MTIYSSYHRRTGRGGSGGDDLGGGFFVQTGGRKNNTSTSSNSNKRRKMLAALYGSLGLLAVYTNVFDMRLPTSLAALRRQLSGCISNVYATESEVLNLPPVPAQGSTYLPSYIKLCYEWMRREAAPNVAYANLNVLENKDICVDWTAPHYAMMEIVASQILSTAIPVSGISYQHKCAEFRSNDEGLLGFDWTPFQTIYQEAAMGVDAQAICEFHCFDVCLVLFLLLPSLAMKVHMIFMGTILITHHLHFFHAFIIIIIIPAMWPSSFPT
jgi:hypothetical protein